MALIDCPECGKSISDRAPACPGCGFPVAQAQGRPTDHQAALPGEQWAGGDVALKGIKDAVALFNVVWGANAAAWMAMIGVVKCLTGDWDMGGGILLVFVPFAFIVAGILGIVTSRTQKPTFGQKSKRYWTFLVLIAISSIIGNHVIRASAPNMGRQHGQSSRPPSASTSQFNRYASERQANSQGEVQDLASPSRQSYTETALGVNMPMVWIPAGSFQMGSPESESGRYDDEGPVHAVALDGFWMGTTEVTQAQYNMVMGTNPSYFKGANLPVDSVSWNGAMAFCRRLSERTGKTYTLPTEAQWEYACRAGSMTRFSFGNSDSDLGAYAWYRGNSNSRTHPVGTKRPNAWGLYDMHGNVWEWCLDWYGADFYGTAAARAKNPVDNNAANERVLRGGSWRLDPLFCRSARRSWGSPADAYRSVGFRVVAAPGG